MALKKLVEIDTVLARYGGHVDTLDPELNFYRLVFVFLLGHAGGAQRSCRSDRAIDCNALQGTRKTLYCSEFLPGRKVPSLFRGWLRRDLTRDTKMTRSTKFVSSMWVLALTLFLAGCPTTNGLDRPSDASEPVAVAAPFLCETAARKEQFIAEAAKMGVSRANAGELYSISGAGSMDVVTGFAPAVDRNPTVERALELVAADQELKAFYVEVDIQNLGGLNSELGHSGADAVFRRMTAIAEEHIRELGPDSCSVRHGGDEFSFVVIGPNATQTAIEEALEQADDEIRAYIASEGLSQIPHPKHPGDQTKLGAGIIYGVSPIGGQASATAVYGVADKIVESKKSE
ncbi:MAG: diguanylate cyclase [Woeseiaceae bacterium]